MEIEIGDNLSCYLLKRGFWIWLLVFFGIVVRVFKIKLNHLQVMAKFKEHEVILDETTSSVKDIQDKLQRCYLAFRKLGAGIKGELQYDVSHERDQDTILIFRDPDASRILFDLHGHWKPDKNGSMPVDRNALVKWFKDNFPRAKNVSLR